MQQPKDEKAQAKPPDKQQSQQGQTGTYPIKRASDTVIEKLKKRETDKLKILLGSYGKMLQKIKDLSSSKDFVYKNDGKRVNDLIFKAEQKYSDIKETIAQEVQLNNDG